MCEIDRKTDRLTDCGSMSTVIEGDNMPYVQSSGLVVNPADMNKARARRRKESDDSAEELRLDPLTERQAVRMTVVIFMFYS